MSTVLYIDAFAGIAGDMFVAALVHAGADLGAVLEEVRGLGVDGWVAHTERVARGAYVATRFVVRPIDGSPAAPRVAGPAHDHGHGHGHDHGHAHGHAHGHPHEPHDHGADEYPGQPSRRWRDIRGVLERAALRPRVRERALRTFAVLAEAEGRVHGMPADEVTFHEVGAVDSIVDIVAACAALEELGVDRLVCGTLPMGHGTVRTAHGLLSVPAPATVEVLRGFPIEASPFSGELVTPTGAALVAALAVPGPLPAMRVRASGYGAGTRDPSTHANVLRVILGDGDAGAVPEVLELRAQVDDLTGESVPALIQALLDAGAVDAWVTPVLMKKGRPGLLVSAITPVAGRVSVGEALLRHSGTFGYRWSVAAREVAARRFDEVATPYGIVRVKVAEHDGVVLHAAPEHEDCAGHARAFGVPVAEVRGWALAAWAGRGK